MVCKGFCIRYKAPKPPSHVGGRYGTGQKRCQICDLFLECEGLWCPCCHYRLRIKPRNPQSKKRILIAVAAQNSSSNQIRRLKTT